MRNIFKNNSLASALAGGMLGLVVGSTGTVGVQALVDDKPKVQYFKKDSAYDSLTDIDDGDVYITPSGERFHSEHCSSLNKARRNNTLKCVERNEAEDVGYLPCKKCNP